MAEVASKSSRPQHRNIHVSQILHYRLPAAGMVSILHRVSGAAMFLMLPFMLWLFQQSLTSEMTFASFRDAVANPLVKLILIGVAWAYLHHFCAGVRHLRMDMHKGLEKEQAKASATAVFAVSLPLTLLVALKIFGAF